MSIIPMNKNETRVSFFSAIFTPAPRIEGTRLLHDMTLLHISMRLPVLRQFYCALGSLNRDE